MDRGNDSEQVVGDGVAAARVGLRVLLVGGDATVATVSAALQTAGVAAEHVPVAPSAADGYDVVLVANGAAGPGSSPSSTAAGREWPVVDVAERSRAAAAATAMGRTSAGAIAVDASTRVVWVRGTRLDLTGREYALMQFFVEHRGQVFTRDELLQQVWHSLMLTDGAVTEYIRRLRMHLASFGLARAIRTRHGFGYYFDPDVPVEPYAADGAEPPGST